MAYYLFSEVRLKFLGKNNFVLRSIQIYGVIFLEKFILRLIYVARRRLLSSANRPGERVRNS